MPNDLYGTYPSRGYATLSKDGGYGNAIFATSNNCNDSEPNAFIKVRSSTEYSTEMSRWPLGLIPQQSTCTGTVANDIDIFLDYSDWSVTHPGDTTSGGENHSTAAPSDYCAWKNVPYPCGSHPSTVHINLTKWNSKTTQWQERLIMHETSHSLGLAHHCTGDSITIAELLLVTAVNG